MYDEYFSKAHELTQAGIPFATATVVRAEAPTSGKPGDRAIVTIDGAMHGWIGGSCAQPTVVKEALRMLAADESCFVRLSADPLNQVPRDGLSDLPMTCFSGGTIEVFIEAHHPRPRLLVIGDLPVAQALAHLGKAMNYQTVAVDLDGSGAMAHADEVLTSVDGIEGWIRPNTFVVVATHGNYDELALTKVIAANPTYVGVVASQKRGTAIYDYLKQSGFGDDELGAVKIPAGLDIQARRGDEIAVSIMAEIVERKRNAEEMDLALFGQQAQSLESKIAIDPICQMEVEVDTAKYKHEHAGDMYYFCCAGCQSRFAATPTQFINQPPATGMISLGDISIG